MNQLPIDLSCRDLDQPYGKFLGLLKDSTGFCNEDFKQCITSCHAPEDGGVCWQHLIDKVNFMQNLTTLPSSEFPFRQDGYRHQVALKLVREACIFQQSRIDKIVPGKRHEREERMSLKVKLIRKKSRKLSRTSKTDSTGSEKNSAEYDFAPSDMGRQINRGQFPQGMITINSPKHVHNKDVLWVDDAYDADYLGIERLIF